MPFRIKTGMVAEWHGCPASNRATPTATPSAAQTGATAAHSAHSAHLRPSRTNARGGALRCPGAAAPRAADSAPLPVAPSWAPPPPSPRTHAPPAYLGRRERRQWRRQAAVKRLRGRINVEAGGLDVLGSCQKAAGKGRLLLVKGIRCWSPVDGEHEKRINRVTIDELGKHTRDQNVVDEGMQGKKQRTPWVIGTKWSVVMLQQAAEERQLKSAAATSTRGKPSYSSFQLCVNAWIAFGGTEVNLSPRRELENRAALQLSGT
ncbi:hypothetical protein FB451DRAFT_1362865 [Mycena latifolia]|nr:hypothetical protein FB451DRAFT_1362865 [Mycena latifolia]